MGSSSSSVAVTGSPMSVPPWVFSSTWIVRFGEAYDGDRFSWPTMVKV